jgi:hypothetical protein
VLFTVKLAAVAAQLTTNRKTGARIASMNQSNANTPGNE